MSLQKPATKRHFTEAARIAAIEARRRKQAAAPPKGLPEVFVVRRPTTNLEFGWEIRRFGAIVLDRSRTEFPTPQEAQAAGDIALPGFMVNP